MAAKLQLASAAYAASAAYVWPSPLDLLEDYYSLQSGSVKHGFVDGPSPSRLFSVPMRTGR